MEASCGLIIRLLYEVHSLTAQSHNNFSLTFIPSSITSLLTVTLIVLYERRLCIIIMPYTYKPLDTTKKQIRLITVIPGRRDSAIRCTLRIVDLDTNSQYEALSYEWGSPEIMRDINLYGYKLPVQENLFLALSQSHLRHEKCSRILWTDTICIDQSSILNAITRSE